MPAMACHAANHLPLTHMYTHGSGSMKTRGFKQLQRSGKREDNGKLSEMQAVLDCILCPTKHEIAKP